jgi:hypothetical protein
MAVKISSLALKTLLSLGAINSLSILSSLFSADVLILHTVPVTHSPYSAGAWSHVYLYLVQPSSNSHHPGNKVHRPLQGVVHLIHGTVTARMELLDLSNLAISTPMP